MHLTKSLILASRSPRRRHLLHQIGLSFQVRESGIAEEYQSHLTPSAYVRLLSQRKAAAVASTVENAFVVGADTIVVLGKTILEKPLDEADAEKMLYALSGRTHEVLTGFTILDRPSNRSVTEVERTKVTFRKLGKEEIRDYVRSGSPMDKAGAYGIQDDYGAVFVARVEGCFYNVVGFPLAKFYTTMQRFQHQLAE